MNIGKLNHLVEIWEYYEVQDEFGEPIKKYTHVTNAWAEIRPLKGMEFFNDKEENTIHSHKIRMRYFDLNIDSTMQIRYDKLGDGSNIRTFEVDGAPSNHLENDVFWLFSVKEVFRHDDVH